MKVQCSLISQSGPLVTPQVLPQRSKMAIAETLEARKFDESAAARPRLHVNKPATTSFGQSAQSAAHQHKDSDQLSAW